MISLITLKAAVVVAAKNAVQVSVSSSVALIMAMPASLILPDVSLNAAAFGAVGGVCRWLTLKLSLKDGLIAVAVGLLVGVGLNGAHLSFISSIFDDMAEPVAERVYALIYGSLGVVVFGFIFDVAAVYSQKRMQL